MSATQAFRESAHRGFFALIAAAYGFITAVIADTRALRARLGSRFSEDS
ncbi:MAG: hypothetical protein LCH61_10790 [Proteobacteria bacterium]|nr:hypothetical protein [Pseudomonadota bacterium]